MMTVYADGVKTASEAERRYTIACINEADPEFSVPMLIKKLSTKTPAEMARMLSGNDVQVTNQKDKDTIVPIVRKTDAHVRQVLQRA